MHKLAGSRLSWRTLHTAEHAAHHGGGGGTLTHCRMVCRPACHKSLAGVHQLMTNPDLENGKLAPCALLLLRQPSMGPHLCQNDVCGIVGCRCAATSMKSNINSFIGLHYINVRDVSGGVCVLRPRAPRLKATCHYRGRDTTKLHHCVAERATLRQKFA